MRLKTAILALTFHCSSSVTLAGTGTEFWAEFSSHPGRVIDFTITIGNPDPTNPASIVIETEAGPVATGSVPPLGTARFDLDYTRKASGSVLAQLAYRVLSDRPVHAYQWSDYDPRGTGSAAILIDRQHWGQEYWALAATADSSDERPSVVTIVAAGPAMVEVVPAADVQAGPGVPAMLAGVPVVFALGAYDVLQLGSVASADLTGTSVRSDSPVEVFAGCQACLVPGTAADDVQDWMLPTALWTNRYFAVSSSTIVGVANAWRFLASEDATSVTTDPLQPGMPVVLNRGEWVEMNSAADFEVTANRPILVGRYTTVPGGNATDPSLALVIPHQYFSTSAIFPLSSFASTPTRWVDIVAPSGASVMVDGVTIPAASFTPIGTSSFLHASVVLDRLLVTHVVESDAPVGIYAGVGSGAHGATFPAAIQFPLNLAPTCDAGGPYTLSCAGPLTRLRLTGAASNDPESQPLGYTWSVGTPSLSFDDASRVDPELTVSGLGMYTIDLQVSDGVNSTSCSTTVTITGTATTPPELDRLATPLWLTRRGSDILFSWQDLGAAPMAYHIYAGAIEAYWSHLPARCGEAGTAVVGGRREAVMTPGPGSLYFQMSAANCLAEGPSGGDPALSVCPP